MCVEEREKRVARTDLPSMVTKNDHDGRRGELEGVKSNEKLPDIVIGIRDSRVVAATEIANVVVVVCVCVWGGGG